MYKQLSLFEEEEDDSLLYTMSLSSLKNSDIKFDYVFLITKTNKTNLCVSDKIKINCGFEELEVPFSWEYNLAPSDNLYNRFLKWKQDLGKDWYNYKWSEYEKQFSSELLLNSKHSLDKIESLLLKNKKVCILCYCKDYKFCHRLLVGKYFGNKGFSVKYE